MTAQHMKEPSAFWQSFTWVAFATVAILVAQLPMFSGAKGWVEDLGKILLGMLLVSRPGDVSLSAVRKVVTSMAPPPSDRDPC